MFDLRARGDPLHRAGEDGCASVASPSKKSVRRIKSTVSELLVAREKGSWPNVRDRLNRLLQGWSAYFSYGTRTRVYRAVDYHVCDRVRHFLRHRRKLHGRGTRSIYPAMVFGALGVLQLRRVQLQPPPRLSSTLLTHPPFDRRWRILATRVCRLTRIMTPPDVRGLGGKSDQQFWLGVERTDREGAAAQHGRPMAACTCVGPRMARRAEPSGRSFSFADLRFETTAWLGW
jgi:RNA-directed DNA polymerase